MKCINRILSCIVVSAGLSWANAALADELGESMNQLCEKMKQCARESMQGQSIPPEMEDMVDRMLEESCTSLRQNYGAAVQSHELYKPAIACMDSLQALSCQEIQNSGQYATGECKAFEEASQRYAGEAAS